MRWWVVYWSRLEYLQTLRVENISALTCMSVRRRSGHFSKYKYHKMTMEPPQRRGYAFSDTEAWVRGAQPKDPKYGQFH